MPIIPVDQKFHTLNASTPTKDRGSAQTDSLREIYTMQDIIDSVTTGGGIDFTELGDTPSTYVGAAGQAAIVNGTEDGLIFGAAGASELTELTDTPAGYDTCDNRIPSPPNPNAWECVDGTPEPAVS